jgi:hypothetical protein
MLTLNGAGEGEIVAYTKDSPFNFRQSEEDGIARGAPGSFSETETKPNCRIDRVAMEETVRQAAIDL